MTDAEQKLLDMIETVQRTQLEPDDMIFIKLNSKFSQASVNQMHALLKDVFKGHKVVFLMAGVDLQIVKPTQVG